MLGYVCTLHRKGLGISLSKSGIIFYLLDCPYQDPQPGLVRCEFLCYGYAIMRDPQTGELSVTMFSQADPGGNVRNIPTWIANKGQVGVWVDHEMESGLVLRGHNQRA